MPVGNGLAAIVFQRAALFFENRATFDLL